MKIEVGKAYRTRDGRRVNVNRTTVVGSHPKRTFFVGVVDGVEHTWDSNGWFRWAPQSHDLDLISLWKDSKTESKMDVKVGDRVMVQGELTRVYTSSVVIKSPCNAYAEIARSAIKSVEPAPPGVGDTVTWDGEPVEWIVLAIDGSDLWTKDADGRRYNADAGFKGFRIIKRAEAK